MQSGEYCYSPLTRSAVVEELDTTTCETQWQQILQEMEDGSGESV